MLRLLQTLYPAIAFGAALSFLPTASWASELRLRIKTEPATLDWHLAHTSVETHFLNNLMEGLFELDEKLEPKPALIEKWSVSNDRMTYSFELRKGVLWSDGKALKSDDVLYAWTRLCDPRTGSTYQRFLEVVAGCDRGGKLAFKRLSDTAFEVRLRAPADDFLQRLCFWATFPMRSGSLSKVTLGPFRLEKWEKGRALVLARNEKYYRAPEFFSSETPTRAVWTVTPDDLEARTKLQRGDFDAFLNATTDDLVKPPEGMSTATFPYLATQYLAFNFRIPLLQDRRIRVAIASGIEPEKLSSELRGGQTPATGFVHPEISRRMGRTAPSRTRVSTLEAQKSLALAGYPEGEGLRRLRLGLTPFDGSDRMRQALTEQLHERLGIEIVVDVQPIERLTTALREKGLDLVVLQWGADVPTPQDFLSVFSGKSPTNRIAWRNADYDQALSARRWSDAEKILVEDEIAIVPLLHPRNVALIRPETKGLTLTPLNYLYLRTVKKLSTSP